MFGIKAACNISYYQWILDPLAVKVPRFQGQGDPLCLPQQLVGGGQVVPRQSFLQAWTQITLALPKSPSQSLLMQSLTHWSVHLSAGVTNTDKPEGRVIKK